MLPLGKQVLLENLLLRRELLFFQEQLTKIIIDKRIIK